METFVRTTNKFTSPCVSAASDEVLPRGNRPSQLRPLRGQHDATIELGKFAAAHADRPSDLHDVATSGVSSIDRGAVNGGYHSSHVADAEPSHHRDPITGAPRRRADDIADVAPGRGEHMRSPQVAAMMRPVRISHSGSPSPTKSGSLSSGAGIRRNGRRGAGAVAARW